MKYLFMVCLLGLPWLLQAAPKQFSYTLLDGKTLSFSLDNQFLERYRTRIRYRPELAEQYVRNGMMRFAASQQQAGLRMQFSPANLPLRIEVQGADSQKATALQQRLATEQQRLINEYLAKHQYRFHEDAHKQTWVIQDHPAHYRQAQQDLIPVAEAFVTLYGNKNIRQVAAGVTSWVEQIPYQNLEDRRTSPGVGFSAPVEVIFQNQGDCDSKAVLWAAIMRQIFPKLPLAMVYFDDHAMVGARIPPIRDEVAIPHNTFNLLLVDATGPAQAKIGYPNPEYLDEIRNEQFTVLDL